MDDQGPVAGTGALPVGPAGADAVDDRCADERDVEARKLALTPRQVNSPLAGTAYDLRHAALSTWLNGGVDATDVAERAGNSVDVLMKRYAKCLDGRQERNNKLIQKALGVEEISDDDGGATQLSPYRAAYVPGNARDAVEQLQAVAKVTDHLDVLLEFHRYPAEHWIHLRTTNPIESGFATARLRQRVSKGHGSRAAGVAMAYKLLEAAQSRWRAVNALTSSRSSAPEHASRRANSSNDPTNQRARLKPPDTPMLVR